MDDSNDSDVILIDSDDNNDCRSQNGGLTINGDTTAIDISTTQQTSPLFNFNNRRRKPTVVQLII